MADHWAAPNGISKMKIFSLKALAANGSALSDMIPVHLYAPGGYFSTYVSMSGSGKVNMRYLNSHDGVNFMTPSAAGTFLTNFALGSGLAGTLGQDIISFSPVLAPFMKIQVEEVDGSAVSVTAWLAMS